MPAMQFVKYILSVTTLFIIINASVRAQSSYQLFEPVNFSKVEVTDKFWKPKMDKVSTTTIQACIYQTEVNTPRMQNFAITAGKMKGTFKGIFYDDSDVFKAMEAIAYALKNKPDAAVEKKADDWIDLIAAAQQPDGYINTYYTLQYPDKRWTDMSMHEDYNGGHLIEAAVAYYEATGKRKLLDVAIKFADHFYSLFGPGKRHWVTGHQELELALVKLYKTTGQKKYLDLADWLLLERGHGYAKGYTWTDWKDTAYAQDVLPVKEQTEITGHAVRAMYLYTGAADVAAITGDAGYMNAMKKVWEDVVHRNMYITGGIGSSGSNEGFSRDYELPNERAYAETCASVGMVFWNQRMNLLTGESKYIDVLERSLYNGALDGLSISGDHFFYGNPLASRGQHFRREWFGTACCPANISRLVASLGNYIYGKSDKDIWVNLYVGSKTIFQLGKNVVPVEMTTNYPWEGNITIALNPPKKTSFSLRLRIPGWVTGKPVPGNLYHYSGNSAEEFTVTVNNKPAHYEMDRGYVVIEGEWKKGDVVQLNLPMEIKRVVARDEVNADSNRVALQRGPLVYCVEGVDNNDKAWNIILPDDAVLRVEPANVLSESILAIKAETPVVTVAADGKSLKTEKKPVTAIPYYTWANRGRSPMQVWLPKSIEEVYINY